MEEDFKDKTVQGSWQVSRNNKAGECSVLLLRKMRGTRKMAWSVMTSSTNRVYTGKKGNIEIQK